MTLKILSDSETGRATYDKEIDFFLENGLPVVRIPSDRPARSPAEPPAENLGGQ